MTERFLIKSADILGLNTAPVEVLASPGPGKMHNIISVFSIMGSGTPYSSYRTLYISHGEVAIFKSSDDYLGINPASPREISGNWQKLVSAETTSQQREDQPLLLGAYFGDPISGDRDLELYITYEIINRYPINCKP